MKNLSVVSQTMKINKRQYYFLEKEYGILKTVGGKQNKFKVNIELLEQF